MLFELAAEVNRGGRPEDARLLKALGSVLGILQQAPRAYLQAGNGVDEAAIAQRIEERLAAKKAGDYSARRCDPRRAWPSEGIVLKDSAAGTTWVRA